MRHVIRKVTLALLAAAVSSSAFAQADKWPSRSITIVGGFPNGSGVDIYARKIGEALTAAWNVPVVVDAKTGAGGNIASDLVARAQPDGYTYLFGTAGTHAINPALYKKLSFDVEKDFTRIAILGDVPNVLLINPKKHPEIKTCADLLKLMRAKPGALNYGSTGNGASTHLAGAQFASAAKVDMVHVPYRGQGPAMTALLGGDVDMFFNQSAPAIASVKGGRTIALAVTSPTRLAALPDVPTVAEACNLPGFVSTTWYGLFGPANLPADISSKMSAEIVKIVSTPAFKTWLTDTQGITPAADPGPAAFARIHKEDMKKWAEIVKISGAQVD
ncbi:Bug family tripartite tricarboxylate transporter substrate binding protein [Zwartia vadi]|uniref:Bug family tripartite tricarboxylate transporter substrate binding protein n=1 Tax=Zwartia vadi TaxID=3058168 RepID=UPI0025B3063C|nr:tripartite tricarboxylate transporter substrate binding protein [Zwartia vadi]MDN3988043.1 tripartite tricarboxylate transporter substrate binding protein [Zwartia vadi]